MDDNKVIRQLIRVNLELEGFEVVTAADGAECLDVVHRVQPDVITLDVVMPRLDGVRTAAMLRADPRTRALPVVMVSACTPHDAGAEVGVSINAFLAKPFEPAELVRIVRRVLEQGGVGEEPAGAGAHGEPDGPGDELVHVTEPGEGGQHGVVGDREACDVGEGAEGGEGDAECAGWGAGA